MPIDSPRLRPVRRWIQLTSGLRASARKSAIRTHASTWRAIHITSSAAATVSTIKSTRRTVRGRKSTTRSTFTLVSIAVRSDVVTVARVSLRGSPVVDHASLPGGGTVEVWVGVPDDPHNDDQQDATTLDDQLRDGTQVLASISTVLDPDQASEALQLVREVKAALEARASRLHASELEPFADRLR